MGKKVLELNSQKPGKATRYADALESSPELLAALQAAAGETLSLRDEVIAAKAILGESIRTLGRATAANGGSMPQSIAVLVLQQMREVNSLVTSCAAIEAKRVDQQFDAAKMILLLGRLRTDICLALKEAGFGMAVKVVTAAFGRASWTGALDQSSVDEALNAPASFDVKFRPIERGADGKLSEGEQTFDDPAEAVRVKSTPGVTTTNSDLDQTARSLKLSQHRDAAEDAKLKAELAQVNDRLDAEIDDAAANGEPLPGVSEVRRSKLNDPLNDMLKKELGDSK